MSTWQCEEPVLKKTWSELFQTVPYPYFIVYDFETILAPRLNEHPTDDLAYLSRHIQISVAVPDTLSKEPVYLVDENPERLTERFIEVLTGKQEAISADVLKQHPYPLDFQILPGEVKEQWRQWVNQVPVINFNSGKYDLNMVKDYFVKEISYNKDDKCNEEVFAAKKENSYMFLTTSKFTFLDVKNYIGPGLSYDAWCRSMDCRLQQLMFPFEWLDGYEKLSHVGPVNREDFYSSLKPTITGNEYGRFLNLFKENDCTTIVIGCGCTTLQALSLLLRPLGRWLGSTILIRLTYTKM